MAAYLLYQLLPQETLGTDLLEEEGCFVITFATPDKVSDAAASRPPASGKRAAVTMLPGSCMKLTPLPPLVPGGPPRIQSTVLTHVTAGKMYVPDMIITFILKVNEGMDQVSCTIAAPAPLLIHDYAHNADGHANVTRARV